MIPMQLNSNDVKILCKGSCSFEDMTDLKKLRPFDETVCDFLSDLSSEIMKNPEAKQYPDVVTFGFFCRRGNIGRLREEYSDRLHDRLGRGVSFHIAPSNVPINFAYSLVAALLAGNACIVRASAKPFRQVDLVCECIAKAASSEKYVELAKYIAVVRYPRSRDINDFFSSLADVRVIWGGDATIAELRQSPLPPRSVEIAFADRYSLAAISAEAVLSSDNLQQLARDFYNDTYLYDQNACSSPRLIYWLGSEEHACAAKKKFWGAVHDFISTKYKVEPVIAVDKYTAACRMAIDFGADITRDRDNLISRISVKGLDKNYPDYRCAGGSFIEYSSKSLDELSSVVTRKYQTLSYFGIEKQKLADIVLDRGLCGIDRIVPIGKTADFALTWDGYDLIMQMSRVLGF